MFHFTKGYSYLWLLLIIIIGAFFFSGGQFYTEDLNKLGVREETGITPRPNVPNNGNTDWDLSVVTTCTGSNNQTRAVFAVQAVTFPAYLIIQIKDDNGIYVTDTVFNTTITKEEENAPTKTLNEAYSERDWRAVLYEGNTIDPDKIKAQLEEEGTECP